MKSILRLSIIATACMAGLASCSEEIQIDPYLNLSVTTYTFQGNGNDSVIVKVKTNAGDWTATTNNSFLEISQPAGDSIVIKAQRNTSPEMRNGSILFSSADGQAQKTMEIAQLTANFRGVFKILPATGRGRMSRNGQWYVYVDRTLIEETNSYKSTTYRVNLSTGETEEIPTPMIPDNFTENVYIEPDEISAVSDDGQYIIFASGGNVTSALARDGEIIPVSIPQGYHHAWLINMDADCSVLIGSVMKERSGGGYWSTPCKWVDGEPIVLDAPQADAINWVTSELDTYPRGCSEDGSIVYGSEWQTFGLCYWTADNKLHNIGIENADISGSEGNWIINMIEVQASYWNISNNGKYIVTDYANNYPVRVNTVTNTYEVLDNLSGMGGSCVTNDGLAFGATPTYIASSGVAIDFENATSTSFKDWVQETYGVTIPGNIWPEIVSPDMKAFAGRGYEAGTASPYNSFWVMRIE